VSSINEPNGGIDGRLTEIFRSVIGQADLQLHAETSRRDIPGWDSMAHIQLVLAVESQFGIRFTPSEMAKFSTVGQLRDLIVVKSGSGNA
jgi:acyl carrier protein